MATANKLISWDLGCTPDKIHVHVRKDRQEIASAELAGDATSFPFTIVTDCSFYDFTVYAVNAAGKVVGAGWKAIREGANCPGSDCVSNVEINAAPPP